MSRSALPPEGSAHGENSNLSQLHRLRDRIAAFRDAREWAQFHNPKNLACAICIEASELLELFQWDTPEQSIATGKQKRAQVADEIADIGIYLIQLASDLEIELADAIEAKIAQNEVKYPEHRAKGTATKYTDLDKR